jgi:hypothetical protein
MGDETRNHRAAMRGATWYGIFLLVLYQFTSVANLVDLPIILS